MIPKPEIQYVGQFYVHGSEAAKLEPKRAQKKPKTRLPLTRLRQVEKVYLDPVAMVAIVVAVVMLAVMIVGALQLKNDWAEYRAASEYASDLRQENARLRKDYRSGYDLEEVRAKAIGLGLVPQEDVATMQVTVTMPIPEPETTWLDELKWFWEGLWA